VVQSLQSLCLYSGCSGLSCASAELDPGERPRQLSLKSFVGGLLF